MVNKLYQCVFCGVFLGKERYEIDDSIDFPNKLSYKFDNKKPYICYDCMEKRNRQIRNKSNVN